MPDLSRTNEKKRAIEEEFGEPFWAVVEGFVEMGYSRRQVAAILEFDLNQFIQLVEAERPDLQFPARTVSDHGDDRRSAETAENIRRGRLRSGKRIRYISHAGISQPISYWDRQIGARHRGCVAKRIANGWPVELAVTKPVRRAPAMAGMDSSSSEAGRFTRPTLQGS